MPPHHLQFDTVIVRALFLLVGIGDCNMICFVSCLNSFWPLYILHTQLYTRTGKSFHAFRPILQGPKASQTLKLLWPVQKAAALMWCRLSAFGSHATDCRSIKFPSNDHGPCFSRISYNHILHTQSCIVQFKESGVLTSFALWCHRFTKLPPKNKQHGSTVLTCFADGPFKVMSMWFLLDLPHNWAGLDWLCSVGKAAV